MADTTLNKADRDMIITLNVKVDRLISDVKDIKDDTVTRITKIETRLDSMDTYHAGIDLAHFRDNSKWVDDLRANFKLFLIVGGIILTIIQAVVIQLINNIIPNYVHLGTR
mgnify:CR=1 FL=1